MTPRALLSHVGSLFGMDLRKVSTAHMGSYQLDPSTLNAKESRKVTSRIRSSSSKFSLDDFDFQNI